MQTLRSLEEIDLSKTSIDAPLLTALSALPALTSLKPKRFSIDCFALLPTFPLLRCISVRVPHSTLATDATLDTTFDALKACPLLADVSVHSEWSNKATAAAFVQRLIASTPLVQSLSLHGIFIRNLSFLSAARHLTALELHSCTNVASSQALLLARFAPGLRTLILRDSVRLTSAQRGETRMGLRELRELVYACDPSKPLATNFM